MRRFIRHLSAVLGVVLAVGARAAEDSERVEGDLPNFHEISPGLYRSGQPSAAGIAQLAKMGVKTILKIRGNRKTDLEAGPLGIELVHLPMGRVLAPSFEQADQALAVMADPSKRPLLVHCAAGKDRTGVVVAAYRVVMEGMDVDQAAAESKSYGCCQLFYPNLRDYLVRYRVHVLNMESDHSRHKVDAVWRIPAGETSVTVIVHTDKADRDPARLRPGARVLDMVYEDRGRYFNVTEAKLLPVGPSLERLAQELERGSPAGVEILERLIGNDHPGAPPPAAPPQRPPLALDGARSVVGQFAAEQAGRLGQGSVAPPPPVSVAAGRGPVPTSGLERPRTKKRRSIWKKLFRALTFR